MLWDTKLSQALGDEAVPACAPRKTSAQVTHRANDTQRPTKKRRLDNDLEAGPKDEGHNATTTIASTNTILAVRNTHEDDTPPTVFTILDLPDEILGIVLEFCSEPCYHPADFWCNDSLSRKAANWRAVCRRFKKVYDKGGFLKRTSVLLLKPSHFTRFTRETPSGLRPTELRFLELSDCDGLTTLAGLEQCQALEILRLKCLKNLLDINVLAKLLALKKM